MAGTARLKKRDWLEIGFVALRSGDADALTMESVCERAGRTRGGFYAHFSGIEDFWLAVVKAWRTEFAEPALARPAGPGRRLDLLNEIAARLDPKLEMGIRRLAFRLPAVARITAEIDASRTAMLRRLYKNAGMTADDSDALSRIEYAALIGLQFTEPQSDAAELRDLYASFLKLTGRD